MYRLVGGRGTGKTYSLLRKANETQRLINEEQRISKENIENLRDKKIAILGFGKQGKSTYNYLRRIFPDKKIGINPYAIAIFGGDVAQKTLQNFVVHHYSYKQVVRFIIGSDKNYRLLTTDEFINQSYFFLDVYAKKSGTKSCPKKYHPTLLAFNDKFIETEGKLYCIDETKWGEYFYMSDNKFFISKKNNGEIRKCDTAHSTPFHIKAKLKSEGV